MAENLATQQAGPRKPGGKKSTRVDLTPMVDLGFLLITFFVFTATMSLPKAMAMVTPNEKEPTTEDKICESCVITVIPSERNKLFYYEGSEKNAVYKITDYSAGGLRMLLVKKKRSVYALKREPVLIIKPGALSSFKNLIDIIDESNIAMYKRYYIDQVSAADARHIE